jgi:hypothetical protein
VAAQVGHLLQERFTDVGHASSLNKAGVAATSASQPFRRYHGAGTC